MCLEKISNNPPITSLKHKKYATSYCAGGLIRFLKDYPDLNLNRLSWLASCSLCTQVCTRCILWLQAACTDGRWTTNLILQVKLPRPNVELQSTTFVVNLKTLFYKLLLVFFNPLTLGHAMKRFPSWKMIVRARCIMKVGNTIVAFWSVGRSSSPYEKLDNHLSCMEQNN